MKIVRFTRIFAPYNAGETAGFPDGRAQQLVDMNVAKFVDGKTGPLRAPEAKSMLRAPADKQVKTLATK